MKIRGLFLLRRYPVSALVFFLLLLALVLMSLRARQQKGIAFIDALVMELCSPFQRTSTFVIQTIHRTFQQYLFLVHLQRENEMLTQRIADLQKENQPEGRGTSRQRALPETPPVPGEDFDLRWLLQK